jgi:hypothetical protein
MNKGFLPFVYPLFINDFRNWPQSLMCGLTLTSFDFHSFETLSTWPSYDDFGDPVNCLLRARSRFTCDSCLDLSLCFSLLSRPGRSLFRFECITFFLVYSLYALAMKSVKSRVAFSSSRHLIWILGEINSGGQALKALPIDEFVNCLRVPSSYVIH